MKRAKLVEFLACTCLILSLFSFLPTLVFEGIAQSGSAVVFVDPSNVTCGVGNYFSIDIAIANVSDLYGWEFKLGWNASLLDESSVNEGPFLNSTGPTFFTYYLNTTDDHVVVDCTLLGEISGANGDGTLANVTFYTNAAGNTSLTLYDVTLIDSSEQQIPCTSQNGSAVIETGDAKIYDLNHDGKINIIDISIVAKAFGTSPGMPGWNPIADVNGDGKVDIKDISLVAKHFGEDP
ncbi:MAG TPA: dockerin type I domain-containing protein [Candidatus Acidoferrum sp.]|nr:dockerin type I domain-containing protein [Candidatus Acidoferrum sp.]